MSMNGLTSYPMQFDNVVHGLVNLVLNNFDTVKVPLSLNKSDGIDNNYCQSLHLCSPIKSDT